MKKSNLKKAFALSALMAFVITGSAYAADVDVAKDTTKKDNPTINVETGQHFNNAGTVIAEDSITVDGGTFNNTGTIETGTLDILTNNSKEIAGAITADKFIFRGSKDQFDYIHGLSAKLKANELLIIGTKSDINPQMATGLQVLNEDVLKNVENIVVESHGIKTGLVIGSVVGNTDNGEKVNATEAEIKTTKRAAILAKADLVSAMVCEFTELQGIMGREYALLDGEGQEVATAIYEHYMPRFAGDAEPASVAGRLVSLADKMDNIVATFSRGLVPTGSQDPFALRRQALGIVHTIIEANYTISISEIADKAMDLLNITDSEKRAEIQKNVAEFFTLRLKNVLGDNDVRYDIIDAVLENADEVAGTYAKACVTAQEIASGVLNDAIQAFVRVGNISKKAENNVINEALFTLDEEKALYNTYVAVAKDVETALNNKDYKTAIDKMQELTAPINNFFDNVMVMDKDEQIKNNRLALLKNIDTLIKSIADFGKIVL